MRFEVELKRDSNIFLNMVKKGQLYDYSITQKNNNKHKIILAQVDKKRPIGITPSTPLFRTFLKKILPFFQEYNQGHITEQLVKAFRGIDSEYTHYINNHEKRIDEKKQKQVIENLKDWTQKYWDLIRLFNDKDTDFTGFLTYLSSWLAADEEKNIMLGTMCHYCTVLKIIPVWFLMLGRSNDGKSTVEQATYKLLPPNLQRNGLVTAKALLRLSKKYGDTYLDGMVLKMGDMGGEDSFKEWQGTLDKFKKMSSEGEDEFEAVGEGIDPETGETNISIFKLYGYPSVCLTSVHSEGINEQYLNRGINATPNNNQDAILKYKMSTPEGGFYSNYINKTIEEELELLYGYINYIRVNINDFKVINPYFLCLEDWFKDDDYYNRALSRYPKMVEAITILNHPYRQKVGDYYISTLEDNEFITAIVGNTSSLSKVAIKIFNKLVDLYPFEYDESEWIEYNDPSITPDIKQYSTIFTVGTAGNKLKKSKDFRNINFGEIFSSLLKTGYLEVVGKVRRGNHNVYRLTQNKHIDIDTLKVDDKKVKEYLNFMSTVYSDVDMGGVFSELEVLENPKTMEKLPFPNWSLYGR